MFHHRLEKGLKATTAYAAARVFDGESERAIEDGAVVVENERIASVGPATEVPPGTEVIDFGDATLLPGLIDAHVHLVWNASFVDHNMAF